MRWILLKLFLLSLCACASTPGIQRYTLHGTALHGTAATVNAEPFSLKGGLGVGPIELPESWRRGEVVVWGGDNQVVVDAGHLWAGDPKLAVSRVLAGNLSQQLQLDDVWAHPWDARAKPQHQILLVIESFGGQLGGVVELKVKWRLMRNYGADVVVTERRILTTPAPEKTYESYVIAINQLILELAATLEVSVRNHL